MYKVLCDFTDMQDGNYLYHAGDKFPRDGMVVKPERINELGSASNRRRKPLIEKVIKYALKDEKAKSRANRGHKRGFEKEIPTEKDEKTE